MFHDLITALLFLTIIPLPQRLHPKFAESSFAHSFSCFPLVGLILGAFSFALAVLLSPFLPPLLLAALLTAVQAVLTRGLHLDGLADSADGLGGAYTQARRLEIMKDSATGAFGALAVSLAVLLKTSALYTLILAESWPSILVIPAMSRYAMVLAAYRSPYARPEGGLGRPFLQHMTYRQPLAASILVLLASMFLTPDRVLLYLAVLSASVLAARRLARRWFGGITGDLLGAVNELMEIVLLVLAACLAPH